jgi:hypothetical protein
MFRTQVPLWERKIVSRQRTIKKQKDTPFIDVSFLFFVGTANFLQGLHQAISIGLNIGF